MKNSIDCVLNGYLNFKNNNATYCKYVPLDTDVPEKIKLFLNSRGLSYHIEASSGKGRFADVPWVIISDPVVTQSAKTDFILLYYF